MFLQFKSQKNQEQNKAFISTRTQNGDTDTVNSNPFVSLMCTLYWQKNYQGDRFEETISRTVALALVLLVIIFFNELLELMPKVSQKSVIVKLWEGCF